VHDFADNASGVDFFVGEGELRGVVLICLQVRDGMSCLPEKFVGRVGVCLNLLHH
jgi:hypothetical protein